MKHYKKYIMLAVLTLAACKSKPAEPPPTQTVAAPKPATTIAAAEPEPEPEPPKPRPALKPLTEVDRSCEADADCTLTNGFTVSGDSMCCATSCDNEAVSAKWLAAAFKVCAENNQNKATFCPPTKCEPSEFNAARCVEGTCEPHKSDQKSKTPGRLGSPGLAQPK